MQNKIIIMFIMATIVGWLGVQRCFKAWNEDNRKYIIRTSLIIALVSSVVLIVNLKYVILAGRDLNISLYSMVNYLIIMTIYYLEMVIVSRFKCKNQGD